MKCEITRAVKSFEKVAKGIQRDSSAKMTFFYGGEKVGLVRRDTTEISLLLHSQAELVVIFM